jgi:hypothetical protein
MISLKMKNFRKVESVATSQTKATAQNSPATGFQEVPLLKLSMVIKK